MLPTGKRFIHSFTRWLNGFLILALLGGLLPPPAQATKLLPFNLRTFSVSNQTNQATPSITVSDFSNTKFPLPETSSLTAVDKDASFFPVASPSASDPIYCTPEDVTIPFEDPSSTANFTYTEGSCIDNFTYYHEPTGGHPAGMLHAYAQQVYYSHTPGCRDNKIDISPETLFGYQLQTVPGLVTTTLTIDGSSNTWTFGGCGLITPQVVYTNGTTMSGSALGGDGGCSWGSSVSSAAYSGRVQTYRVTVNPATLDGNYRHFYLDNFRFKVECGSGTVPHPKLYIDATLSADECPFCGNDERVHYVGGPINTQSGNYNYETTDLTVAAVGQPLTFERTYNSLTTMAATAVYSRPLGYGWTHNYDISLAFEGSTVILKAPHGSRLRFQDHQNGAYSAYPGVWATLVGTGDLFGRVYTATAANQERFVFDWLGRLTDQYDPAGNRTTFSRDGQNLRITAPGGSWLELTHDGDGRLTGLADSAGRQVVYGYSPAGDLTTVVDTRGLTWTYTYTGSHLLYEVRNPKGYPAGEVVERTQYQMVNGQMRAVRQENGLGRPVVEIAYQPDQVGNQVRTVTEMGRTVTDKYNSLNLLIEQTDALNRSRSFGFDPALNRTGLTDERGNDTGTARTPLGFTTAITDALNQPTYLAYDEFHHPTVITDARGTVTTYTWNLAGHTLAAVGTVSGTIQYDYNGWGQVLTVTNRLGQRTTFGYDSAGNLITTTDADNHTTRFGYDSLGRVITVTNARSVVSLLTYDPADHVTRLTENYIAGTCPAGEWCNRVTEYGYDPAGRLVTVREFRETGFRETRTEYNDAGQVCKITRNYKNGGYDPAEPDEDVTTRYEYDEVGRLRSVFETTDASPERETRYTYDSLNRLASVTLNANSSPALTTSYHYEDRPEDGAAIVKTTGPDGLVTRTVYDKLDRVAEVSKNYVEGACPAANDCKLTTEYVYDPVGNLVRVIDPLGVRTEYRYDRLNRLTGVTENYTGDGVYAGLPDRNVTTGYRYDNEGNLTRVIFPAEAPGSRYLAYSYGCLNKSRG